MRGGAAGRSRRDVKWGWVGDDGRAVDLSVILDFVWSLAAEVSVALYLLAALLGINVRYLK